MVSQSDSGTENSEGLDKANPLPEISSEDNVGSYMSIGPMSGSSSLRERFDSIQRRRLTRLVELESSEEGGLIDRRLHRSSVEVNELRSAVNRGSSYSAIFDVLKLGRNSSMFGSISTKSSGGIRNIGGASTTSTLRNSPVNVKLHMTWKDVKYEIKTKGETKEILHGISGEARPGEMLAIMGSSGAGKTTLLNILAGRVATGTISGDILVNGRKRDARSWKYMIGYVEEKDVMYGTLTVKETLYYSALLRLPPYLTHEQKKARALQVMTELGLSSAAKTRIGDEFNRGVSGGEKKRVSIGIELVANPGLLFLDEPTSGLDAYTAYNIMESISVLALRELKTVIATIHQPREDILFLFDKLLLITKGQCAYFGPTVNAMNWFERLGYTCPTFVNPADFFVDLISIDTRNKELENSSMERTKRVVEQWKEHTNRVSVLVERGSSVTENQNEEAASIQEINPALSILIPEQQARQLSKLKELSKRNVIHPRNSWFDEFIIMLRRAFIHQLRDLTITYMLIANTLATILIVAFSFFQIPLTQSGLQALVGIMFVLVINTSFYALETVSLIFPLERDIILRERYSETYRISSYYVSRAIPLLPIQIIFALISIWSSYYIIGLNPAADRFFILQGIIIVTIFCSYSVGLFTGAISKKPQQAQLFALLLLFVMYIYAGNLIPIELVPPELSWLQYLSTMKYSYSAAMQNEFDGLVFQCENNQPPVNGSCSPGFATGQQVLEHYDLLQFSVSTNCLIILGLGIGFNILGYIALRFLTKPKIRL